MVAKKDNLKELIGREVTIFVSGLKYNGRILAVLNSDYILFCDKFGINVHINTNQITAIVEGEK